MINLVKQKFEKLAVVRQNGKDNNNHVLWLCLCDCGQEVVVQSSHLITGHTKSCGCLKREGNNTKHKHTLNNKPSKIYQTWANIIQRCTNPNSKNYHCYGGRGIAVCKRWIKFENFLKDMGEKSSPEHQIDRINNDGNYCKSNCRWATRKQQARNRRDNHLETHNGKTQCLVTWTEEFNIPYHILWKRIHVYKWSMEKALTTPIKRIIK